MRVKSKHQSGNILIVSVIVLVVLAGLSIAVLMGGATEKKIAHNDQDQVLAKHSAEVAVSTAKQQLQDSWGIGMTECASAPCTCASGVPCVWSDTVFAGQDLTQQTAAWWSSYSTTLAKPNPELTAGPQYIIMDLGCDIGNNANIFRIVGRGAGALANTVAYSDVTFSMPSTGSNSSSTKTAAVTALVNGATQSTFNMSPSTVSAGFWVSRTCAQSGSSYAQCETNCIGQVRVMAWTYDNHCVKTYGSWSNTSSSISITRSGSNYTVACKLATPPTTCPTASGKTKTCSSGGSTGGSTGGTDTGGGGTCGGDFGTPCGGGGTPGW